MTAVLLEPASRRLACPNCTLTELEKVVAVRPGQYAQRFHNCAGLKGMLAPLLDAKVVEQRKAAVRAIEREDYVGKELGIRYDGSGMAVMAVETVRDDGTDRAVFAACAYGESRPEGS